MNFSQILISLRECVAIAVLQILQNKPKVPGGTIRSIGGVKTVVRRLAMVSIKSVIGFITGFAVEADSVPTGSGSFRGANVDPALLDCGKRSRLRGEMQMKFSKPLVLLLGSVLSASGIGCSAITAVVSDSRPAHRENRCDADRLVAIGRVFENQGRYDKAEVMYRKAQKMNPQDPSIRNQLQQLTERQQDQRFGPTGTADAIAMADSVRPPQRTAPHPVQPLAVMAVGTGRSDELPSHQSSDIQDLPQVSIQANIALQPDSEEALTSAIEPQIELVSASKQGWRKSDSHSVTAEEVMIALQDPDQYVDLLLEALANGDGLETQSLAATLLGDCDPANTQVRDALSCQRDLQSNPDLLLAICDSQIERGEAHQATANCLISLCTGFSGETQIQAAAQLRNFSGTEHEALCVSAIVELRANEEQKVRATAAATLGDFSGLESGIVMRLQELAGADASENVREAAESALARQQPTATQDVPSNIIESE